MEATNLTSEVKNFRERLKRLRDQYSDLASSDMYVEVEDCARRAYRQLGHVQDSLEVLSEELTRIEKHMLNLVKAERKMNTKRASAGEPELTVCHTTHRDFSASNLLKLK